MLATIFFIEYLALAVFCVFCILVYFKNSRESVLSNKYMGLFALIVVFTCIFSILARIIIEPGLEINAFWMITILFAPIVALILLIFFSTTLNNVIKYRFSFTLKFFYELETRLTQKIQVMNQTRQDTVRKINHVLMFVGLLVLWYICVVILLSVVGSLKGMIPEEQNVILVFFLMFSDQISPASALLNFGWFYYVIFYVFYVLFIVMIANEFTRKSHRTCLPFNYISRIVLTDEEIRSYGTYLYFSIGHLLASLFCPPMVFFAILGVSSIADLVASQVGIRFGKKQIRWNRKKTWEGSIAASLACFFICLLFVGITLSILFSVVFLVVDIITGVGFRNLNLSDNLLTPIALTLVYIFVEMAFNVPHQALLVFW
ncbi:MAG: hypothetical protein JW891_07505 [Candidatus Lokiarchaeota archaeon]|nr:hypothetical protein [Candidatus Lokiarchaeota archaeon]